VSPPKILSGVYDYYLNSGCSIVSNIIDRIPAVVGGCSVISVVSKACGVVTGSEITTN